MDKLIFLMDAIEMSIVSTGKLDISLQTQVSEKEESFTEVKKKSTRGNKPKDQNSSKKEKEFKTPHFVGIVPFWGTQKLDDTKLDNILKITAGQKLLGNKEVIRWFIWRLKFPFKANPKGRK